MVRFVFTIVVLAVLPLSAARTVSAAPKADLLYVDLGDTTNEEAFTLQGWGTAQGPAGTIASPTGDQTLRNMVLGGDSALTFSNLVNGDYLLTAEIGDGLCDDSFQILAGDEILYSYQAQDVPVVLFGPHEVLVDRHLVKHHELTVTFRNTAEDSCGLAGVYNVMLQKI